ncbi:MAG: hypothetical protein MZU79_08775 [Anaerotruncus sp.]|nr:hypothetical protein [Anaerotruncus sp.]
MSGSSRRFWRGPPSQASGSRAMRRDAQPVYDDAFRQYQQGKLRPGGCRASDRSFWNTPEASLADDALYYAALCNQALGQPHRAIEELVAVYYMYPAGDRAASALWRGRRPSTPCIPLPQSGTGLKR